MAEKKSASNVALYRKFRPQNFSNLKGQANIQTTLLNALKKGQVAQAYLFSGPRGTGKTTAARLVAKGLNCNNLLKNGEPCNECEMCEAINNGQLVDIIEIDAASNRGIDEIRDIREKIKFSPVRGKKKVYIIDEVHMLTDYAFNALLKTLEEPPSHAHMILATTEVHKIPATIISRCQHFDFKRIDEDSIVDRLVFIAKEENIKTEKQALDLIANSSDGSLRDAIGLFEQMVFDQKITLDHVTTHLGLVDTSIIEKFITLLEENNVDEGIRYINQIYTQGIDLIQLVKNVKESLRKRLINDVESRIREDILHTLTILKLLDTVEKELKKATIPQLPLELLFVELSLATTERKTGTTGDLGATTPINRSAKTPATSHTSDNVPPADTKEEVPVDGTSVIKEIKHESLSLDGFRTYWGQIIDSIDVPTVKFALRQANLKQFANNELLIILNSHFEFNKINNVKCRDAIERGIQKVLNVNVLIKLHYEKQEKPEETEKEEEKSTANISHDIISHLTESFGATLINE